MVARHDLTTDPRLQEELLQARRGTAFFARKLNELTDEELDGGTRLPGWTRRHVVAHVGYNARAIARLIEWAATGVETPMYPSPEARNQEIDFGATLSPTALRNLFDHSAVHLSVEWRDLPDADWSNEVRTAQGRTVPASETAWMRTREVWMHAVDLDNGATFNDIPAPVLERLLKDITSAWRTRGSDTGLLIKVTGTGLTFGDTSAADPTIVAGPLPAVVEWAAGRGSNGVTAAGPATPTGEVPVAPKWI
ncbi:maleylpyruvate isomerase family mycothiol-dependent enzyme [Paenarthrobacter ureafaciens]|jgi:maleylpyruvate isomerase|uniref:maleylpyruvate isomerase family mycothiol-dependent enzyme n=1 Tax=Paenarthrobacter ureafaciens TaxID=37931 RepID=UPI0014093276|nr:maleylpyruvate isomerase family mycothiol-dependent enzyme [Paenarthrobacter ureafaciens]MCX8456670.1 maleylpyruvate isomerase family mycothiol-dependent enzyme [Paenarthrobacter ureafaciens]MCY0974935.1 maleylpyruvate isomerase family mycothiol-dependent enzyme [Paenarthrobacter ureafaciens]